MEVGGSAELRNWVMTFGAGAEVLEPASLRKDVIDELRKMTERYGAN
jgi:predicted DNA-binding transcriptional regulator YafY